MIATSRPTRTALRALRYVGEGIATFGAMLDFGRRAIVHSLFDIVLRQKYRSVVFRQISDVVTGAGAVLAGGGMIFVIAAMSLATGATVGLQGFTALQQIGAQSFSGLIASFGNVREITPIIAGVALAAQVGASFTAEIGAMRISDEIDALEVMSIPSLEYVVCTRLVATHARPPPPVFRFALLRLLRGPRDHHQVPGPVPGHLRPLFPLLPAAPRHPLQRRQSDRSSPSPS